MIQYISLISLPEVLLSVFANASLMQINLAGAAMMFLFGLAIGSFTNVLIYRLPNNVPMVKGNTRSFCPACKGQIRNIDLIPVLSYLFLRGKCRGCGAKISVRYPLIEFTNGLLYVLVFLYAPFTLDAVIYALLGSCLLTITMIDFDVQEIPDSLVIAIIPLAIASIFIFSEISILSRIIGFFCISLPMFILINIIEDAFGGGDIKLIAVCGFLLGWQNTLLGMFIAIMLGGLSAVLLLAMKKTERKSHIPFGPCICMGVFTALLFGDGIIGAYLGFFGL